MLLKYLVSLPFILIEGSASYFSLSYCPTGDASRGGVKGALSYKIGLAGAVDTCFGALTCCMDVTIALAFIAVYGFMEVLGNSNRVACNIDSFRQEVVCHLWCRANNFEEDSGLSIEAVVRTFEPHG